MFNVAAAVMNDQMSVQQPFPIRNVLFQDSREG